MSHSGMSVAQAKELQRRYNDVTVLALKAPAEGIGYATTEDMFKDVLSEPVGDKIDAVSLAHIVVSRDKNHKGELVSKTLKSRKGNVGLGGFTVQRFER